MSDLISSDVIVIINSLPSAQPEIKKDGDTISRAEAIDALRVAYWDYNIQSAKDDPCIVDAMTAWAIRQVKALPSTQPEIIRCKDCKYCDRGIDEDGIPFLKCLGWSYGGTHEDDFCSHAERRSE